MTAYAIVNYTITNAEAYKAYTASVLPTIISHGGEILVAGPGSKVIEGSPAPITVVLKFPSQQALQDWYDSPEYQAIIHHRLENTEGSMVFADEFRMPG